MLLISLELDLQMRAVTDCCKSGCMFMPMALTDWP